MNPTVTDASVLLSLCDELDHIDSVFVLSTLKFDRPDLTKILGVYSELESLCESLITKYSNRRRRRNDRFEFQPLSSDFEPSDDENNESETPPSYGIDVDFMCSKFLREILNQIDTTKQEMIDFCIWKCGHNQQDVNNIEQFREYYTAEHAINWYTRDTFLYRLLNEALRTMNMETMYSLRFFIRDLDAQLMTRFQSQMLGSASLILYRGQLMTAPELEDKIVNNVNGFYSVASFLSTTQNRFLAEIFAGGEDTPEAYSVLFEIEVPEGKRKTAYANISEESAFGDGESEILFTMGSVFRIMSATEIRERNWLIKLKLSDDDKGEETREAELRLQNEIISVNGTMSLARLAFRMARYDTAIKFYDLLLQNPPVNEEFIPQSEIHEELAFVYYTFRQYENAIEHYEASLRIDFNDYPVKDIRFIKRYSDLGCAYLANHDYMLAEGVMNRAMDIIKDLPEADQTSLEIYTKIVADFFRAKKRDNSIQSLNEGENSPIQRCLTFLEKYPNSLSLGNDIGSIYYVQGNYEKAMEMYELCLANLLSANRYDPRVAQTYNDIGIVHLDSGRYDTAIEYFNKQLEISKRISHSNHLDIAAANKAMAMCYYHQGDSHQAIACWVKVLNIHIYNFSNAHSTVDEDMAWIDHIALGPPETIESDEEST